MTERSEALFLNINFYSILTSRWVKNVYICSLNFELVLLNVLSMRLFTLFITTCTCLLLLFTSCLSSKNIPYFQDIKDPSKIYSQVINENYEAHIQPDDIIEINTYSLLEGIYFIQIQDTKKTITKKIIIQH